MTINCVLCLSDKSGEYYKHTYVVLMSIFANTKERVHVHIITDETLRDKHGVFQELCDQYQQQITFYEAPGINPEIMKNIPDSLGAGSLYRFFIHEFIPLDKIIYLDCDVICERDLDELHRIDIRDHVLAAKYDEFGSHYHHRKKSPYLDPSGYFNSGVLLLNLDKLRQLSKAQPCNIFINKYNEVAATLPAGARLPFPDQDILNALFTQAKGEVLFLDESFNLFPARCPNGLPALPDLKGTIIHFVGEKKPWDENFFPHHLLYWQYYAKAPWGRDAVDKIMARQNSETYEMLRFANRHRKLWRWDRDIDRHGFWGFLKLRWRKNTADKKQKD